MPELTYISLGWGVQSWTIAAMVALGDLPPIDLAIHSDTGHEAAGTYAHAEKWTPWLTEHGIQVVTVKPENNSIIREDWGKKSGSPSIQIPAFTLTHPSEDNAGGANAKEGQIGRQCTREWKITPIRRHLRSILGPGRLKPGSLVCWQGISLDEWSRMRDSDVGYIQNVYPLVDRRMTRLDCVKWLQQHNLDVPQKSACVFCPFHKKSEWRQLKQQGGSDWDHAMDVDQAIRKKRDTMDIFIHPSRLPLEEAVRIPEDLGAQQLELDLPCDGGVCFV